MFVLSFLAAVVMPPPFIMGGGHIASPLSVHTYVPYVLSRTYEKWFPGDVF